MLPLSLVAVSIVCDFFCARVVLHWPYTQWRHTALMRAAENGYADCVRLLIDAGADTEANSYVSLVLTCSRAFFL